MSSRRLSGMVHLRPIRRPRLGRLGYSHGHCFGKAHLVRQLVQVAGHVLGRWVEVELVVQVVVVPPVVDVALELVELPVVTYETDPVELLGGEVNADDVVVAVKAGAWVSFW